MRLSWKLHAAVVAVTAGVLALQVRLRLDREESLFEAETVRDHLVMGRAMRHAVEDQWDDGGAAAAQALVQRLDIREPTVRIRLLEQGQSSDGAAWMDREVAELHEVSGVVEQGEDLWRITFVPVLDPPGTGARIEIRESLVAQERYMSDSAKRSVMWLVVLLGTTTLVLSLLLRWMVLDPVDLLIGHARRIGSGDLESRVRFTSADELGQLGRELDQMADSLRDAAERVASEQAARERAVNQLRHADRLMTVGTLAAGVAHELGTPLNVALIRARMIERAEVLDPDEARENAKSIAEQCERMASIIRQVLNFARPRKLERASEDLRALAAQTIGFVRPMASRAGVTITLVGEEPVRADVDSQQLQQVVINLLTNAIQASDTGATIEVDVATETREGPSGWGRWAVIRVDDHGTGMDAEQVGHVFEPFYTTKPVGVGTGLGMSVSHGIVRDHEGFITFESALGRGTSAQVYLPLPA
ncbi:MAG: HAMP domain-containing sensor histidine kinase [Myxococcota bacterium]